MAQILKVLKGFVIRENRWLVKFNSAMDRNDARLDEIVIVVPKIIDINLKKQTKKKQRHKDTVVLSLFIVL